MRREEEILCIFSFFYSLTITILFSTLYSPDHAVIHTNPQQSQQPSHLQKRVFLFFVPTLRFLSLFACVCLFLGVDKYGNLFGTVRIKNGDIAAKLLENGYAKYVKWSGALTGYGDRLRNLEDGAKMQRLRLWSNYDPEKDESKDMPPTQLMGTVSNILSGDRFEMKVMGAEKPQRINLASIRSPRMPNRSNPVPEPLAMQSREFLRGLFAKDKKVKCIVDYTRTVGNRSPDLYATVYLGTVCINDAMLAHGYAEAIRHNKDEDRSGIYSRLLVTEQAAQKAKKGVHNPSLEAKPFKDFTQPSAKGEDGKVQLLVFVFARLLFCLHSALYE